MPATKVDAPTLEERIRALEAQLAQRDAALAGMEARYEGLRQRKAVRAALKLASLRPRRSRPAAPPPAAGPAAAPGVPERVAHVWDLGHFYSPVPDTRELACEPAHSRVWPAAPRAPQGFDLRIEAQLALLGELAAQPPLPFPDAATEDPTEYHTGNPNFGAVDAWVLQAMLRHHRPRRVIEVGCGWSSLVTARVNRQHFGGTIDVTCIEPFPPDFLVDAGVDGLGRLVVAPVQDVPLDTFAALADGDVLFIDTSHVVKTGNDVRFLYHEVVPRLAPGVLVHIHDIFLPWDYPAEWVLGGRGWNEQYLVESFLAFNSEFEVLLGVASVVHHAYAAIDAAVPEGAGGGGGSLWIRRRGAG